jgi:hypothetical protein
MGWSVNPKTAANAMNLVRTDCVKAGRRIVALSARGIVPGRILVLSLWVGRQWLDKRRLFAVSGGGMVSQSWFRRCGGHFAPLLVAHPVPGWRASASCFRPPGQHQSRRPSHTNLLLKVKLHWTRKSRSSQDLMCKSEPVISAGCSTFSTPRSVGAMSFRAPMGCSFA